MLASELMTCDAAYPPWIAATPDLGLPACLQAMSLMLPQPGTMKCESVEDFQGDSTLGGKMACLSVSGYAACAKTNVDLDAVLGAIKVRPKTLAAPVHTLHAARSAVVA